MKRLLQISGIFGHTNTRIVNHLCRESEFLKKQLTEYTPISQRFETKFCFEAYETDIPGYKKVLVSHILSHMNLKELRYCYQLVPQASAVVPGAMNAEQVLLYKDHIRMAKFSTENDNDFRTLCRHLRKMAGQTTGQ
jgi:hypothetical protein